jgi:hypothetical protein
MYCFLIEALAASEALSPTQFDPAPDSISTKWPLLVALPFIAFVLWLLVDAVLLRLRRRSHERTLIVTNEILTIEHLGNESNSTSDHDRGSSA